MWVTARDAARDARRVVGSETQGAARVAREFVTPLGDAFRIPRTRSEEEREEVPAHVSRLGTILTRSARRGG
jgi:hypothetical protein